MYLYTYTHVHLYMYVCIYIYNIYICLPSPDQAEVGVQDKGGNTPLHLATMCGDANLKVLLLTFVCACLCMREAVY